METVKHNTGWSQRQVSGEAVKGFKSFLNGETFKDNPYDTEMKYKDWAAGFRNGKIATSEQIKMFKWIYSID